MNNQNKKRLEFYNLLVANGYKCKMVDGGSRLDIEICLYYGDESIVSDKVLKNFTKGILGVFWNSNGENHRVAYLGHNIDKFDGYEIHGDWVDITLDNVITIVKNDIELLQKHINK